MDAYCQKLKDLADQLGDVDHPVPESRLVLQLVRGLPTEFDVVGAFINQSNPSWDTARSMLQLEQHRQNARQNQSKTVLVAPHPDRLTQQPTGSQSDYQGGRNPSVQYDNRSFYNQGRSRGHSSYRGRGRNNRGRGRHPRNYYQHNVPPQGTWNHPHQPHSLLLQHLNTQVRSLLDLHLPIQLGHSTYLMVLNMEQLTLHLKTQPTHHLLHLHHLRVSRISDHMS